jgi:hypothetical protein
VAQDGLGNFMGTILVILNSMILASSLTMAERSQQTMIINAERNEYMEQLGRNLRYELDNYDYNKAPSEPSSFIVKRVDVTLVCKKFIVIGDAVTDADVIVTAAQFPSLKSQMSSRYIILYHEVKKPMLKIFGHVFGY